MINNLPTSPEQRQHVNLSQYAYDVITNDSLTFWGKVNTSGFINTIVINSGIHHFEEVLLNEKSRITDELKKSKRKISDGDHKVIENIAQAHLNNYILQCSSAPKEVSIKIRLQNELHEDLYPAFGDWDGAIYHITQGEFIKAVIEDYARKTFFEREGVFYKNNIETINNHINSDEAKKGILPIIMNDGQKLYIKPLRISEDYEAPYHYLIGMSSLEPDNGYKPSSTRISRIKSVKRSLSSYVSGKITHKEQKELEAKIKNNKVPYLWGETESFKIILSEDGLRLYNSMFHQRPMYDSIEKEKDGSSIMTFTATERQITNYFFPFGNEAMIISPEKTRKWMEEKYEAAAKSYSKRKEN